MSFLDSPPLPDQQKEGLKCETFNSLFNLVLVFSCEGPARGTVNNSCEFTMTNASVLSLEPFHWVMEWKDIITQQHFISLLEKHFFPRWIQVCVV